MKKIIFLILFISNFTCNTQANTNPSISFAKSFQFTIGFENLAINNSMMGEAHDATFPSLTGHLGIFHYNKFSIGLYTSVHYIDIKNTQYYGTSNIRKL